MKSTSSSLGNSVNYFALLAMEDESESETASENPQEADREVQEREVREQQKANKQAPKPMQPAKPEEGTAEWVLWMLHQNTEKGRKVLE